MSISKPYVDSTVSIDFSLDEVVHGLKAVRQQCHRRLNQREFLDGCRLPSPAAINEAVQLLTGALFPMRLGPDDLLREDEDLYVVTTLGNALNILLPQIQTELWHQQIEKAKPYADYHAQAKQIAQQFSNDLPHLRSMLDLDLLAAYYGDPAALSVDEVLLCYPGVQAMIYYRIAHRLHQLGVPLIARIITETVHGKTGIDIHPGAQIDEGFFIDHGTGVVIGGTCIIGKNVRLYQAVTLGAKSFPSDENGHLQKGVPRHPIVEDDVVIYAGATILGRITIGKGSAIGGNIWLTHSVPPGSILTQADTNKCKVLNEM